MIDYRYPRIFNIYALQFDTIKTNTGKPKEASYKLQWRPYKGFEPFNNWTSRREFFIARDNYGNMHYLTCVDLVWKDDRIGSRQNFWSCVLWWTRRADYGKGKGIAAAQINAYRTKGISASVWMLFTSSQAHLLQEEGYSRDTIPAGTIHGKRRLVIKIWVLECS